MKTLILILTLIVVASGENLSGAVTVRPETRTHRSAR